MATMRMKESKFGAPAGTYKAVFLGLEPMRNDGGPRLGRDGKPMAPGVEWQFQIVEGEHVGQLVGRITAAEPTTKNSCGVLLAGLVGRTLQPNEDVDPDAYKGQMYEIWIDHSKENPEKTHVIKVIRKGGNGQPAGASRPAVPPARPASPPPPPARPAAPAPAAAGPSLPGGEPTYWVDTGAEQTQEMSGTAIRELLKKGSPEILGVMSIDGTTGWKPPSHFGLDQPF